MSTTLRIALVGALIALTGCAPTQRVPEVEASISNTTVHGTPTPQDPSILPPVPTGDRVTVNLQLIDKTIEIAPGTKYQTWTFDGTVPGPVIHARVGQTIDVTLTNKSQMGHSIDFHSALAPPDVAYQTIAPGQTIHFDWVAKFPGAFLYHCGTPPVLLHISNGMYGAVIVDPEKGWPNGEMRSYVLLQSEFYTAPVAGHPGLYSADYTKARESMPDLVEFNGYAMQYAERPLPIDVDQPTRLFVINAGPSHFSAFHVIGTVFETVYLGGNPSNALHGLQTAAIAPGDGNVIEFTVHQKGRYPFVTHSFGDADLGAMGALKTQN